MTASLVSRRFPGHHTRKRWILVPVLLLGALLPHGARAADGEDWPTYRHDNLRSGVTEEALELSGIRRIWTYDRALPPRPAWPGPAKWDAYAQILDLKNMRNYDPVYHVTVAGSSLYFGSSSEDCVRCLDIRTGNEMWVFFTDGPVRLPPSCDGGKVYFGSDDGNAYCVDAEDGMLVWKYRATPEDRAIPSDGKLISTWPVRTGVLVADGKAYFASSLLPWKTSYLCAVDAATGSNAGDGLYSISRGSVTMEGALLASATRLYVPQGRREPVVFNRATGAYVGAMTGGGGVFCLVTADSTFVHGPGNKAGWLQESNAQSCDLLATIAGGNLMVVAGGTAYIQKQTSLIALNRADRRTLWSVPCPYKRALIKAGNHLVAGGDGEVAALDPTNGEVLWTESVDGRAYGLAVACGTLFVSTDTGAIAAFGPAPPPGGRQRPGDATQDGALDISDAISLLHHLFGAGASALPCEGDSPAAGGNLTLLDLNADLRVDIADGICLLGYLFGNGPPPALGTECVCMEGCPDRCRP